MEKKKRHYCSGCKSKIMEEKMYLLMIPYLWEKMWVCVKCFNSYGTSISVKKFPEKVPLQRTATPPLPHHVFECMR